MKIQIIEIDSGKKATKYTLPEFLDLDWHGLYIKYKSEIKDILIKKAYLDLDADKKDIKKSYLVLIDSDYIMRYDINIIVEIKIKIDTSGTYYPEHNK